jgi:hypothetical protein
MEVLEQTWHASITAKTRESIAFIHEASKRISILEDSNGRLRSALRCSSTGNIHSISRKPLGQQEQDQDQESQQQPNAQPNKPNRKLRRTNSNPMINTLFVLPDHLSKEKSMLLGKFSLIETQTLTLSLS